MVTSSLAALASQPVLSSRGLAGMDAVTLLWREGSNPSDRSETAYYGVLTMPLVMTGVALLNSSSAELVERSGGGPAQREREGKAARPLPPWFPHTAPSSLEDSVSAPPLQ